ncbi:cysteine methyltransferase [Pseudomonas agarici]|uniref:Methylated-DNA--protein-cysteine methyltransferase n=1 Tax=Pseudomonas agarici TaxID=46677 RepID=A0A0X1T487_PSEAA|nr:methylated-DNA--[protein]-cysteine S-methyltransferase [Pseudomonas agarici]AMB86772.1 cysteine methyltransferase [Pseudomonas agarici]NWB90785.1 methylated-DNA--[protein]-cysteine S-methyltransferase [Pseudomonas agarici]NWC08577.1 methylated-DNA--[protein]-cysteine S-methyltransferase [Pseudomonas agarici]SEL25116.1 methylated-DNA-[protein]-cysteine S-methyltransferase [Pseudomonas agarici]
MTASQIYYDVIPSPIGPMMLVADDEGLRELRFELDYRPQTPLTGWLHAPEKLAAVRRQLEEYFAGERLEFDLKLNMQGTDFQREVWDALTTIPYGVVTSYGQICQQIDRPKAARAVGAANGRNPVPVIVPCHRVIGSNGTLTGFGGGLAAKQWLLEHESRHFQLR